MPVRVRRVRVSSGLTARGGLKRRKGNDLPEFLFSIENDRRQWYYTLGSRRVQIILDRFMAVETHVILSIWSGSKWARLVDCMLRDQPGVATTDEAYDHARKQALEWAIMLIDG